jgi:hypothetical protein
LEILKVSTELIDIEELRPPAEDAGEGVKDARFTTAMERAGGIVIVSPFWFWGIKTNQNGLYGCVERTKAQPEFV